MELWPLMTNKEKLVHLLEFLICINKELFHRMSVSANLFVYMRFDTIPAAI